MIFGEIVTNKNYYDFYPEILCLMNKHYSNVESCVQGDAYIWITQDDERVALYTFTSMLFQIKSNATGGSLVEDVIKTIKIDYPVYLYKDPLLEGDEVPHNRPN